MPGPSLTAIFASRLNRAGIPYIITGAVASIIYGEPRLTHDLDLVVMMKDEDIERLVQAFPSTEFYCPPPEVLTIEMRRPYRGHFNLMHHGTGAKPDIFLGGEDDLHQWAFSLRKEFTFQGERVWVAPPEYVIIRKLEYYREGGFEKHLRDISGILELSPKEINFRQLKDLVHRCGLEKEWAKVRATH